MWYEEECPSEAECVVCSLPPPTAPEPACGGGMTNVPDDCSTTTTVTLLGSAASPAVARGASDASAAKLPAGRPMTPANPKYIDLPHNFYWAIPNKLIGMGCPLRRRHIENLHNHYKVAAVVNLRECGSSQQMFDGLPVQNVHSPIKSFGVPTMEQVQQFVRFLDEVLEGSDEMGEESESEEMSPTEGYGDANSSQSASDLCERKDGRKGTQATNIDAGRCNDCESGATAESGEDEEEGKKDKRKRGLCKKGEESSCELGIRKKMKKDRRNRRGGEKEGPSDLPSRAVAVNCRWGKGRTGTMIACYLVHKEGITADEAIRKVRGLSAGSLETRGQEEFVEEFYRLKLVNEGREGDYKRSLLYPFVAQNRNTRTAIVNSNNTPGAGVTTVTANGVIYGRHEPSATHTSARKAAVSNKICWNNSLLVAKMYK